MGLKREQPGDRFRSLTGKVTATPMSQKGEIIPYTSPVNHIPPMPTYHPVSFGGPRENNNTFTAFVRGGDIVTHRTSTSVSVHSYTDARSTTNNHYHPPVIPRIEIGDLFNKVADFLRPHAQPFTPAVFTGETTPKERNQARLLGEFGEGVRGAVAAFTIDVIADMTERTQKRALLAAERLEAIRVDSMSRNAGYQPRRPYNVRARFEEDRHELVKNGKTLKMLDSLIKADDEPQQPKARAFSIAVHLGKGKHATSAGDGMASTSVESDDGGVSVSVGVSSGRYSSK